MHRCDCQHPTLSPREAEVLAQLALGKTPRHIGEELSISTKTVETYVLRLRKRFALDNIYELIVYACWHAIYGPLPPRRHP
jgi:DNA-binding CsgD family transcriptional regulator